MEFDSALVIGVWFIPAKEDSKCGSKTYIDSTKLFRGHKKFWTLVVLKNCLPSSFSLGFIPLVMPSQQRALILWKCECTSTSQQDKDQTHTGTKMCSDEELKIFLMDTILLISVLNIILSLDCPLLFMINVTITLQHLNSNICHSNNLKRAFNLSAC